MPVNMTRLGDTISEADIMLSQHHHQKFNRIYLDSIATFEVELQKS